MTNYYFYEKRVCFFSLQVGQKFSKKWVNFQSKNSDLSLEEKIILLANEFQNRLTSLVANWIRVGYCQGNFNSDNCAAGGFTLDYGPFGFIEMFDPKYQSWTGGGMHFSFFNQPRAAQKNFKSFCSALKPLLTENTKALQELEKIENNFSKIMQKKMVKLEGKL